MSRTAKTVPSRYGGSAPCLTEFSSRFLDYVDSCRLEAKTKEYYRSGWRLLSAQPVAAMRLDAITTSITAIITAPGGGSSVNSALCTLRRMLSLAAEWDVIHKPPRIPLAREKPRERMLTPAEETQILAKASSTMRAVVTLILDTGMRPSEAAALRWSSVDFLTGVILIWDGKTRNARRHLPMTARVRAVLTERLSEASPWVFPSSRHPGKPMRAETLTGMFSNLTRQIGLPTDLVLYSARHTFATDFLQATGNVAKLKKVMGHSSLATTERYLHPEIADLGAIMDSRNAGRDARRGGLISTPVPEPMAAATRGRNSCRLAAARLRIGFAAVALRRVAGGTSAASPLGERRRRAPVEGILARGNP